MKKTLIALAVIGAAGVAHAQSNVTIYGIADVGVVKTSGTTAYLDENVNNPLGSMGSQDLRGGLKATFQLEQRFTLQDGANHKDGRLFEGGANLGLAGAFGQFRIGRVNDISVETYRAIDPFYQYGVAGAIENAIRKPRISDTVRWDSPNWNGFKLGATYTLASNTTDGGGAVTEYDHAGYAIGGTYTNGPIYLVANYDKLGSVSGSKAGTVLPAATSYSNYLWNIGGAYTWGAARFEAGYEETKLDQTDKSDRSHVVL